MGHVSDTIEIIVLKRYNKKEKQDIKTPQRPRKVISFPRGMGLAVFARARQVL